MRLSEYIAVLQAVLDGNGDLPVLAQPGDDLEPTNVPHVARWNGEVVVFL